MKYYAALNASLRSVLVYVMGEEGEIQAEGQVDSEVEVIVTFLARLNFQVEAVGLETGTLTQYSTYGVQTAGYRVVCMEARHDKSKPRYLPLRMT